MITRRANRLALLLVLVAVGVSAVLSNIIFDRIPHLEDEFALLWQAEIMADGQVSLPSPDVPASFMIPFVVDINGVRFGKYPPGWPAALSLGARLDEPWLVQALLSGFCVWLIYRLGQKTMTSRAGLLAAGLCVLSPIFLMQSSTLLAHMFALLLTLGFLHTWLDLFILQPDERVPKGVLIAAGGGTLGLLALTRPWTAIAVALPAFIHGVILLVRRSRAGWRSVLMLGAVAGGIAVLLFLWQAVLSGDPFQDGYSLWWAYDRLGFGEGHGPLAGGHTLGAGWANTRFSLTIGLHDLYGWPYLSWLFLPVGLWALRKKPGTWLALAVFPVLVLLYLAYWTGAWLLGPRYYFEGLPGLVLATAAGVDWLFEKAKRRPRPLPGKLGLMILLIMLVVGNVAFYLPQRLGGLVDLYGISNETLERFHTPDLESGLIIVHTPRWMPYANLSLLSYPFSESGMDVALNQGRDVDEALALAYDENGLFVYHYYVDQPNVLYMQVFDHETGDRTK